jgi:hypothetical protein
MRVPNDPQIVEAHFANLGRDEGSVEPLQYLRAVQRESTTQPGASFP